MTEVLSMKTGDRVPSLILMAADEDKVSDLRDVTAWRIRGAVGGLLVLDVVPDTVSIDSSAPWAAALEYAWKAGDTDHVGLMRVEVRATWATGEQTFPARGAVLVQFEARVA